MCVVVSVGVISVLNFLDISSLFLARVCRGAFFWGGGHVLLMFGALRHELVAALDFSFFCFS